MNETMSSNSAKPDFYLLSISSELQVSTALPPRQEGVQSLEDLHHNRLVSMPVIGMQDKSFDVPALQSFTDWLILEADVDTQNIMESVGHLSRICTLHI